MGNVPDILDMKRLLHLRSRYFFNSYVQASSLLKYNGYEETISKSNPQQEYIYPEYSIKKKVSQKNSSNLSTKSPIKESSKQMSEQESPLNKSRRKNEEDP